MIDLGSLVQSQNNSLGIGKVVEISQPDVTVEYFCSGGQRLKKRLPWDSLSEVRLEPQTRCYIPYPTQDTWIIGRICQWDEDTEMYQIDLPDQKSMVAAEPDIYVRCNIPVADPMEILAMRSHETPYFHDKRLNFVDCMIRERSVSCGMSGLMSANIELYPHQVEVIRRVLQDPIQRYLLADEQGLGKTIEAGVILRQFLLDEPKKGSIILVPSNLLQQWRTELENKFYISHFGKRVVVLSVEDIHKVNPRASIGCLIIDAAHHIAAMATDRDAGARQRFESCKNLAHKSNRLLLLSANSVFADEQGFLAMLHLLDPNSYKLHDLAGFRARWQNCREIGRIMLSLTEDATASVVQSNLQALTKLLTDRLGDVAKDEYFLSLADSLEKSLAVKTDQQSQIIREIRSHVSSSYRIYHRIISNRRGAVEDVMFERDLTPKEEYDLDERSLGIHELLEKWRKLAPQDKQYQRIFLLLFLAGGTWLGILERVITARLNGKIISQLVPDFSAHDLEILTTTPKFTGEAEILQSLLSTICHSVEDGERTENLKTVLLNQLASHFKLSPSVRRNKQELETRIQHRIRRPIPGDILPKIVVFSGFSQSAEAIFQCLSHSFGMEAVVSLQHEQAGNIGESLNKFRNNHNCFVLVCDRSGEEGLNLQFADCLIHFDLPWLPQQLEQRIGRFDRIGCKMRVDSSVLIGPYLEPSIHNAWYQILKNGWGIFQHSIANLEFYINKKLPELETTLFKSGATGLLAMIETIKQEMSAAQIEVTEYTSMDEIAWLDDRSNQYFSDIDDYDASHLEIKQAVEGWICEALGFKSVINPNSQDIKRYQPTTRTLVSVEELKNHFANHNTEQFGTYNRRVANHNSGIKLFRTGEGLLEAITNYIHWDDRGKTFALWRTDKSWDASLDKEWFGFRFNYFIQANVKTREIFHSYNLDISQSKSWQRLIDTLFPPLLKTIFIDCRSQPMSLVTDESLLNILRRPYKDKNIDTSKDYNLAKERLAIIDSFVDGSQWKDFCYQAASTACNLLSNHPEFMMLRQKLSQNAAEQLTKRAKQLRICSNIKTEDDVTGNQLRAVGMELEMESPLITAVAEGILQPMIHLDSVGFMILSGRHPM